MSSLYPVYAQSAYENEYAHYNQALHKAKDLRNEHQYGPAAQQYIRAYQYSENLYDAYNAAGTYSLARKPEKAFQILKMIYFQYDYYKYNFIADYIDKDSDFKNLYLYPSWKSVLEDFKRIKEKATLKFDQSLIAEIREIEFDDQKYRVKFDSIAEPYGQDAEQFKILRHNMVMQDSVNLMKVDSILKNGWIRKEIIGTVSCETLFLVIHHAADPSVRVKYLPVILKAVENGDLEKQDIGLIKDRMATESGEAQLYGTQLQVDSVSGNTFFLPIKDVENVDQRRKEIGLKPIALYAKEYGIEWSVQTYRNDIKKYLTNE